jgi:hypothetical protein
MQCEPTHDPASNAGLELKVGSASQTRSVRSNKPLAEQEATDTESSSSMSHENVMARRLRVNKTFLIASPPERGKAIMTSR